MVERSLEFLAHRGKDDSGNILSQCVSCHIVEIHLCLYVLLKIFHALDAKDREHYFIFERGPLVEMEFVDVSEFTQMLLDVR